VAHCSARAKRSFLYTLTQANIASEWTECLPLLSKSAEAVLSALEHARASFPFPILERDIDNGCEFINELENATEPNFLWCEARRGNSQSIRND
jgi:hypothetical protein